MPACARNPIGVAVGIGIDPDADTDSDPEKMHLEQGARRLAAARGLRSGGGGSPPLSHG